MQVSFPILANSVKKAAPPVSQCRVEALNHHRIPLYASSTLDKPKHIEGLVEVLEKIFPGAIIVVFIAA